MENENQNNKPNNIKFVLITILIGVISGTIANILGFHYQDIFNRISATSKPSTYTSNSSKGNDEEVKQNNSLKDSSNQKSTDNQKTLESSEPEKSLNSISVTYDYLSTVNNQMAMWLNSNESRQLFISAKYSDGQIEDVTSQYSYIVNNYNDNSIAEGKLLISDGRIKWINCDSNWYKVTIFYKDKSVSFVVAVSFI